MGASGSLTPSLGAGLRTQCPGSQVPVAFALQYYEMSYGLNIEMHKQVLRGRGSGGRLGLEARGMPRCTFGAS